MVQVVRWLDFDMWVCNRTGVEMMYVRGRVSSLMSFEASV